MQKFLLKIFAITYVLAFTAPFVFADTTVNLNMCSTNTEKAFTYDASSVITEKTIEGTDESGDSTSSTVKIIDQEKKAKLIEEWTTKYNDNINEGNGAGSCGTTINSSTGFLEKGDCTRAGKIITELSEFTPDMSTELVNESAEKSFVTTVYAGTCCLIGMKNSDGTIECDDVRTVYTPTYADCEKVATDCTKRVWVIGTSGGDLLKLTVKYLYGWATGVIGIIAVVTIVYNGVKISMSGISGDVSAAKDKILQAVTAIVILFLSGLILYTINPTFFG